MIRCRDANTEQAERISESPNAPIKAGCSVLEQESLMDMFLVRTMKLLCGVTLIFTLALSYYIYLPLPAGVSEPWKLLLVGATFRTATHLLPDGPRCSFSYVVCQFLFIAVYKSKRVCKGGGGGGTARHFLQRDVLARYSVDPERVAVCGDSAGGNLAAAVAQQIGQDRRGDADGMDGSDDARESSGGDGVKFKLQVLIYPVLQPLDFNTASYQQSQGVPILYRDLMARYWLEYLGADASLLQTILLNNHTALDESHVNPHRSKVDWTSMTPKHMSKQYKAIFPQTGSPSVLRDVPSMLDPRAAPLLAEQEILKTVPRGLHYDMRA
ncbi:Neutral cholesterol ester hydrolase 1 [Bagarius yarrelli]|uniref:Neutral cholesterol ester hydrolase 1 n=1 Tax=Bagarius yarrelli TaxID=175774 RepID=A0A556VBT4_BAGYA|nr:Neutral cholesterol ester hydrolase 1 [Bagarius yarrelli]